jgi:hypothetical protein
VRIDELLPAVVRAKGDQPEVVVDQHAKYFGSELADDSLVPGPDAWLSAVTYTEWAKAVR